MDTHCPTCQRPYGKRRRCYYCNGRSKTGHMLQCGYCGSAFYAARWQLEDTVARQPKYCSRPCVTAAMQLSGPGYKYPRQDGYVSVYYPAHPDAPKSGWMMEHRLVAEHMLGRRLLRQEHVHHINGDRGDNRPENLQVVMAGDHARISNAYGKQLRASEREELAEYRRRYGPLN